MIFEWIRQLLTRPRHEVALERICIETGVLEECPVCRTFVDKERDDRLPIADELLEQHITAHDPALARFHGNTPAARNALRELRKRYPFSCLCESTG